MTGLNVFNNSQAIADVGVEDVNAFPTALTTMVAAVGRIAGAERLNSQNLANE